MKATIFESEESVVARLAERFTFTDHSVFRGMVADLVARHAKRIVLDLAGVTFVDSSALGMLLLARDEAGKVNKTVILRNPAGQVEQVLRLSKFDTMFAFESI